MGDLRFRRKSIWLIWGVHIIRPACDFSFPGIAEDVARLGRLLREAMALLKITPKGPVAILNLACGRADETGTLLQCLSLPGQGGMYLGLDLRDAEIHEAKRRWQSSWQPNGIVEFRVADASLSRHMPTQSEYDFVLIRHQNYWDAPATWDQIYRLALGRLKPTGLLIFTSYFEHEHELAMASLKSMGAQVLIDLPHAASRPLRDAPGKSVDKRIAIVAPSQDSPAV